MSLNSLAFGSVILFYLSQFKGDRLRLIAQLGLLENSYWSDIKTAIDIQLGFFG